MNPQGEGFAYRFISNASMNNRKIERIDGYIIKKGATGAQDVKR